MNEHDQEDDWGRLGHSLRNYQPAGNPDQDFAAFQSLQKADQPGPRRLLFWLGLGMVLMCCGVAFLLQNPTYADEQQVHSAVVKEVPDKLTMTLSASDHSVANDPPKFLAGNPKEITTGQDINTSRRPPPQKDVVARASDLNERTSQKQAVVINSPPPLVFTGAEDTALVGPEVGSSTSVVTEKGDETLQPTNSDGTSVSGLREGSGVLSLKWPVVVLDTKAPNAGTVQPVESSELRPVKNATLITFNTGLSTHWRGSTFLAEPDYGLYVSVGVEQQFGKFSLGGRFGYRGHNMNLEVLEGEAKPWSHYEDKTSNFNDLGEEVEYTYTGVVNGYKGLEFSLLLGYQLSPRMQVKVGGRYSLPSLESTTTTERSSVVSTVSATTFRWRPYSTWEWWTSSRMKGNG